MLEENSLIKSTIKTDRDSHESTIESKGEDLHMRDLILTPLSENKSVLETNFNFNCRHIMIFNFNL